ncbi:uncharacterized protein BO97DRAFT_211788 [Aspergillus homomorphus CBS 101889]|uniref:Uncharacterized protein n=1 Tax=Aspergillus homomorphus (strain CBS 101889) TaxID=1450537 RepID=A0A395I8P9_ASPHC|nr:hypothetical protein BO97DRAFT_211788 [Aspergillus homomorphus CBS 101889]RAL15428.1 hypothetical protein BO97DRAFT_211788 [Aspergillus homomorphus CBS 101889]
MYEHSYVYLIYFIFTWLSFIHHTNTFAFFSSASSRCYSKSSAYMAQITVSPLQAAMSVQYKFNPILKSYVTHNPKSDSRISDVNRAQNALAMPRHASPA